MQVEFTLNYRAVWGQTLHILFYDKNGKETEYEMSCVSESIWTKKVDFPSPTPFKSYNYLIKNQDGSKMQELDGKRKLNGLLKNPNTHFIDFWREPNGDSPFDTVAFSECFFKRKPKKQKKTSESGFTLQLHCAQMEPDRHFAIIGNQEMLGNWDVNKKIRLDDSKYPIWSISLNPKEIKFPLEYKYLIVNTKTDEVLAWGGGPNRKVEKIKAGETTIVTDENFLRTIPSWKTSGVALPVFSLRSNDDFGTGDFMDLIKLIDWAKATGQRIIQTLPINDTILYHTNYDSYPYNAVSVYALHPIYLRLEKMGILKDEKQKTYFETKKKQLNENKFSDYQNVLNEKWKYFEAIFKQESAAVFALEDYKIYFEKNKEWLVPYAAFSYLRDLNKTPEFRKWKKYSVYDKEEIEAFTQRHYKEISFYYFLQYHLHVQLAEVTDYAHKNGIAIKSDVPIGVSPRSVDAWTEPQFFNTNMQAGAPPDDFSVTGQNWGFPTYNWEEMEKDGYQWWRKRFQKFVEYFDAYRIDHVLGFFRIWEIPEKDVWALTGSFSPAIPYSKDELQQKGIYFDEDRFLKPYMREHVVKAVFEVYAEDVMREYLVTDGWQNFKFKPEFDTQKKIETHFSALGYNFSTKEVAIRDGLYALHCEVLFVRDKQNPELFHPRISMQDSYTFRDMPENVRKNLNNVYVDYFYHRHTEFWKQQALKKLPALISATNMLVCGEDLGMVPDSVPDVMRRLEMLSLEIQRMPKKPGVEFAMPADAPYLSVCTTSTHDMNPIRAWWEENPELTQRFYNFALGMQGQAPEECTPEIAQMMVKQHLDSTAMLVILPWQDWIAMSKKLRLKNPNAERINLPSNPRNFWCYRMHISLDKLLKERQINALIKKMIQESGR